MVPDHFHYHFLWQHLMLVAAMISIPGGTFKTQAFKAAAPPARIERDSRSVVPTQALGSAQKSDTI